METLWMSLAYQKQITDWSDLALFETIIKFTWEAMKKTTEGRKQTWKQVFELHRFMMAQPWRLTTQARRLATLRQHILKLAGSKPL
jgi:hypothetical protein